MTNSIQRLIKELPMHVQSILDIKDTQEKIVALRSFCDLHATNLTETEQIIISILDLEYEVQNGGFIQYFSNSAGNRWKIAYDGFAKIGDTKRYTIFTKVLSLFKNSNPPVDQDERESLLGEKISKDGNSLFDSFDQEYYELEEDISSFIISYAEKNKSDFGVNEKPGTYEYIQILPVI